MKSNHSLRVTGATHIWETNVIVDPAEDRARSLVALRTYEHASITQQRAVSDVLVSSEVSNIWSNFASIMSIFTTTSTYFGHLCSN